MDEVEKAVKGFKPVTIDPAKEIKAIEAFEVKAVRRTLSPLFFGRGCGGSGVDEGFEKNLEGVKAGGEVDGPWAERGSPRCPPKKATETDSLMFLSIPGFRRRGDHVQDQGRARRPQGCARQHPAVATYRGPARTLPPPPSLPSLAPPPTTLPPPKEKGR